MVKTKLGYEIGGGCEISQVPKNFLKKKYFQKYIRIYIYIYRKETVAVNSAGCEISQATNFRNLRNFASNEIFGFLLCRN